MIRIKPATQNLVQRTAKCKACGKPLIRSEKVGDKCPKCRGK